MELDNFYKLNLQNNTEKQNEIAERERDRDRDRERQRECESVCVCVWKRQTHMQINKDTSKTDRETM